MKTAFSLSKWLISLLTTAILVGVLSMVATGQNSEKLGYQTLHDKALALAQNGENEAAASTLEKAIALYSGDDKEQLSMMKLTLGMIYQKLGRDADSDRLLNEIVQEAEQAAREARLKPPKNP